MDTSWQPVNYSVLTVASLKNQIEFEGTRFPLETEFISLFYLVSTVQLAFKV
jgi:hypothetical protein